MRFRNPLYLLAYIWSANKQSYTVPSG